MKRILVLGAGQSTPYLINYLFQEADTHDWFITIGDLNLDNAQRAVDNRPRGTAVLFDVNDSAMRETHIKKANIVVNMLAPIFHPMVALECARLGSHFVSASYEDERISALDQDAHRRNLLFLSEMGLDPGIDHMSAMKLIQSVREQGGIVKAFLSYGSGIPAPDSLDNPMKYAITWNPRNVVRAGEAGALYKEEGKVKLLPYQHVFQRTWPVEVEDIGTLEAYPNRNSLIYQEIFGLQDVDTMIRGTLRYPGWSETWHQLVRLGLSNDTMPYKLLNQITYREFLELFLPLHVSGTRLENRVANFLQINPTGKIMENLRWLGLFTKEVIGGNPTSAVDVMTQLLIKKMPLMPNGRDMIILHHEIEAIYPENSGKRKRIQSTLIEYGERGGFTAMSKTVGFPAAIAVKLILTNQLQLRGCHIPTHPAIYEPVLEELRKSGLQFREKTWDVTDGAEG